jgi:N-methylhydantoinase B/oxoprolinase/acetone carboxylase alpha subunit
VTDANVVLGRIDKDNFLGGEMPLDDAAAHRVIHQLAQRLGLSDIEAAEGIITIVNNKVCAGIGHLKVIAASGFRRNRPWVHLEIFEGSYGGRYGRDGMDAVDTLYANTRNNPVEDIESPVPLRVERYELREDACATRIVQVTLPDSDSQRASVSRVSCP